MATILENDIISSLTNTKTILLNSYLISLYWYQKPIFRHQDDGPRPISCWDIGYFWKFGGHFEKWLPFPLGENLTLHSYLFYIFSHGKYIYQVPCFYHKVHTFYNVLKLFTYWQIMYIGTEKWIYIEIWILLVFEIVSHFVIWLPFSKMVAKLALYAYNYFYHGNWYHNHRIWHQNASLLIIW